jgi:hypothetical protein
MRGKVIGKYSVLNKSKINTYKVLVAFLLIFLCNYTPFFKIMAHYLLYKPPHMKCLNTREAAASAESSLSLSQGMSWILWKSFLLVAG